MLSNSGQQVKHKLVHCFFKKLSFSQSIGIVFFIHDKYWILYYMDQT